MTYADDILNYLQSSHHAVCDDCLAAILQLPYRQQARSRSQGLAKLGRVVRDAGAVCSRCQKCKTCSTATLASHPPPQFTNGSTDRPIGKTEQQSGTSAGENPWFWEGHVQNVVADWLTNDGWQVRCVDTLSKEVGKDIVAKRGDRELWISVKGFPKGTSKTNPATQARHWFSHAMFDVIRYRTENEAVELAIALPVRGTTYRNLATKSQWGFRHAGARIIWVFENGSVESQSFH